MAAPTVTRPIAPPTDAAASSALKVEEIARWAKWVVLAVVVGGVIALFAVIIVSYTEQKQNDELRKKWDDVYTAVKDKTKAVDRIVALEGVMQKIAGSPAHCYALLALGNLYFEQATNARFARDERNSALEKATRIYEMIVQTEPFHSNLAFAPLATSSLATAYEQDGKYDDEIKLLDGAVNEPNAVERHLYKQLQAQLGRAYWLRSMKKSEAGQSPEADRKDARKHITEALRTTENDRGGEAWREEAEFIKAVTEAPGKALPDGKAPAERVKPDPEKKADDKDNKDKKDSTDVKKPEEKKDAAAPATPAAPNDKKPEAKPDEKKAPKADEPKTEPKKDGSINLPDDPAVDPSVPVSPSGHLTFSQIQKALKEGRPAFCNCPRCQAGNAPPAGVRLAD